MKTPHRAILVESGAPGSDLPSSFTTCLLPVVDRPMVQHSVEFLVRLGIKRVDFVLHHFPNRVEQFLGDGARWGCEFHFHLTQNPSRSYHSIRFLDRTFSDDSILIGIVDELPGSDIEANLRTPSSLDPQAFVTRRAGAGNDDESGEMEWAGWAVIHANRLRNLVDTKSSVEFRSELLAQARDSGNVVEVCAPMSTRCAEALLESNRTTLRRRFGATPAAGIHIGRNARLHHSVKVFPPVFVGDNAYVGPDSRLGPNVVIGRDSAVSANCVLEDALVFPGTYVGPRLSLHHAIVDNNRLINVRLGAVVEDVDSLLLRQLSNAAPSVRGRLRGRSLALALLVLFLPVLLSATLWFVLTRGTRSIRRIQFVELPAAQNPDLWNVRSLWALGSTDKQGSAVVRHFFSVFLPGLPQVLAGCLDLSGISPRSQAELLKLPREWRNLILQNTCGLVNESVLRNGAEGGLMEVWAAESFYSVQRTYETDLRMLFHYFRLVGSELVGNRALSAVQDAKSQTETL